MELKMIEVDGKIQEPKLELIALSTCGFCKKGMAWLSERDWAYSYIFLDQLPPDEKSKYKEFFFNTYEQSLSYPTLIINKKSLLVGFIPLIWDEKLSTQ